MRRPRWVRRLAISTLAVAFSAGMVYALRTSVAEGPGSGTIRIVEGSAASTDASSTTSGNRIRFPTSPPPADFATRRATASGGVVTSGYEAPAGDAASGGYPVRTAAAEAPLPPAAPMRSTAGAAHLTGQPTMAPPRNPLPPSNVSGAAPPAAGPYAPSNAPANYPAPRATAGAAPTAGGTPPAGSSAIPTASNRVPSNTSGADTLPPGPAASPYGAPYSTASLPAPGTSLPSGTPAAPAAAAPREMPPANRAPVHAGTGLATTPARSQTGVPPTQAPPPRTMAGTTAAHAYNQGPARAAGEGAGRDEGTGRPGEQSLEGAQAPALTIEKLAPPEIQIGKPAVFEIVVRNTGSAAADEVEIHDLVPQGTQLMSTSPEVRPGPRGELAWALGTLAPGDEAVVKMELMPTNEGEIGSVATVHFAAAAGVRTLCTRPELLIQVDAPRSALAGDEVPLHIRVSNPGTGVATGIMLTEVVPDGLEHEAGGELEYEVGDLQPGQVRELDLSLRAVRPGTAVNLLAGKGDGRLVHEVRTQIEITAPALAINIDGPKRRYLERQATYVVTIANPGTAPARDVELATYLPKGMEFVDADNHGEYDPASHSVRWSLEELPAREQGSVSLTALPVEPGQQLLRIESSADRGVTARKEEAVLVEGAASIVFQIRDAADPVEVGGETTYEILVANDGSKEATNVRLAINLAEGMKVLEAEGPSKFTVSGRQVVFQPLAQLAPKAEGIFRVRVACASAGDHRCQVQLLSDDMRTPITKEEGTRVYADE